MAACVYIPVQNSEEEVRVAIDHLPRDASDIIDILKAEQAPLDLWLIIAREYFKQGKIEQFRQILEEGSSPEIDEYYADVKRERVSILSALGVYYTYLGKIEAKHREKEDNFSRATQFYERAKKISNIESSVWVGKGQISLAKGELDQASASFGVLKEDDGNVATLLCQACIHFNNGRYSDSLDLYKKVMRVHPGCPAPVRLGLGLCYYKMGQSAKARKSFQRVLQLDCENVEALVALGVMDLQTNDASGIKSGMINLQRAFELDPYNATSLNYLANHFFFTGQHFLVEQLTETALSVTNHGPTKSHSYYNLARSYHSKGDYEKAGVYYMASVNEISKPHDFVLPYYGLGQVQLKFGDLKSSLSSFEKVLEVYPENCESLKAIGHIHVQLGQADKAMDFLRKSVRIDPRDYQAFMDLGELLVSTDGSAALDAFKTAHNLLKKRGKDVPIELLNYIGVLQFERGELESAEQYLKEALGDGIWQTWIHSADNGGSYHTFESKSPIYQYKDVEIFSRLEEDGVPVDVPWDKVTVLFNIARLFEELHDTGTASMLYRLILFKYPEYCDAYLRLAAISKARNNIQLSIELVGEVLKIDYKCCDALSMLGDLELKNDDWVKAKDTLRASLDAADGKDSYATLSLGNWNYFAAIRSEKKAPKLEATHIEKARELFSKVLVQHSSNLYAANGAGLVLAEKGHFEVSKDIFTQVQEAASGSIFVQIPDVWINLAHVYYAQGNFALAIKMYQNCMRKFFYNTDVHIHLYLARTYYEAEQWQDCKKALLRAIHISPSTHTLRFNAGVTMQKFSASTLQKEKKTADEVRLTVSELKNAVRVFTMLSAASSLNIHGFDEKKMETHVGYCKHLLEAAKKHCEAAEAEEQQIRQKMELARQYSIAEEARRKAEEQRKSQMERRKQEDEVKRVMQQEEQFQRVKEQWRSNTHGKRKERWQAEEEEGGHDQRKKKGGKRRKKDKENRLEADIVESQDELEEEEPYSVQDNNTHDALTAAGLEDSDYEDQDVVGGTRKRWESSGSEDEDMEGRFNVESERDEAEQTGVDHQ